MVWAAAKVFGGHHPCEGLAIAVNGTCRPIDGEFGIPPAGTHAHSWVMAFATEQEAFDAYAEAQPNNCVLLVDTYDAVELDRPSWATPSVV